MHIVRPLIGAVVGVILAFAIVAGVEAIGYGIQPAPADLDWSDAKQVNLHLHSLPVVALLTLLAGWVGATFVGAVVGAAIARPRAILISTIVGGLMLAATGANFLVSPHPWWLMIATVSGIVAATWLAAKLLWKPAGVAGSA